MDCLNRSQSSSSIGFGQADCKLPVDERVPLTGRGKSAKSLFNSLLLNLLEGSNVEGLPDVLLNIIFVTSASRGNQSFSPLNHSFDCEMKFPSYVGLYTLYVKYTQE